VTSWLSPISFHVDDFAPAPPRSEPRLQNPLRRMYFRRTVACGCLLPVSYVPLRCDSVRHMRSRGIDWHE
jgi:hypothetical protein